MLINLVMAAAGIFLFFFVVGLVVDAFGLNSSSTGGAGPATDISTALKPIDSPYPIAQAANALFASFGDVKGASAALLAADRGYTAQQVIGAAVEKRLAGDGQVRSASGQPEPPKGTPYKRFTSLPREPEPLFAALPGGVHSPALVSALNTDAIDDFVVKQLDTREIRAPSRKPAPSPEDRRLTALVMGLIYSGYSVDQIVEGVTLGNTMVVMGINTSRGLENMVVMFDRNKYVCPGQNQNQDCSPVGLLLATTDFTVVKKESAAAPSPAAPTAAPTSTSGRICAEGVPAGFSLAGLTVEKDTFSVCFPRTGGAVEGKVELVVSSSDDDCFGRISGNVSMAGTFSGSALSGSSQEVVTVALQGVCARERELLDPSTTRNLPPWQGTFDGTNRPVGPKLLRTYSPSP